MRRLLLIALLFGSTTSHAEPTPLPEILADPEADWVGAARRALDEGRLADASEIATAAAARTPTDAAAHELAALALSRIRVEEPGEVCLWRAWPDVIEDHLAAARHLDPGLRERLAEDPALQPVRQALANSLRLRVWTSRRRVLRRATGVQARVERAGVRVPALIRPVRPRVVEAWLVETAWYGVVDGEHDDTELRLDADGGAFLGRVVRDADHAKHAEITTGSWTADGDQVHVVLEGEELSLRLTVWGLRADGELRFIDRPVDCTRPFDVWEELPDPG